MTLQLRSNGPLHLQQSYEASIRAVLQQVRRTHAGRIVLRHIEQSSRVVTILPYTGRDRNAEAVPASQAASGTFSGTRTARGTNSRVRFSVDRSTMPSNWPQGSADEVLLHELSHALRQINGAERYQRTASGGRDLLRIASFENVEEFFAAMVASVHSSELGRRPLGNHGAWPLPDVQALQQPPDSTRIREMRVRMPPFTTEMAAIPASTVQFNPFRDVH